MITRLLTLLVTGDRAVVEGLLHDEVVFQQGDGTLLYGRGAVLAMFESSDPGVSYRVLEVVEGDRVRVGMVLRDPPVTLAFMLRGRMLDGCLVEVRVEP